MGSLKHQPHTTTRFPLNEPYFIPTGGILKLGWGGCSFGRHDNEVYSFVGLYWALFVNLPKKPK